MTLLPYITSANFFKVKRPIFIFIFFPLAYQIKSYVTILKLLSLKFKYLKILHSQNNKHLN
jgi:hypothetical protein